MLTASVAEKRLENTASVHLYSINYYYVADLKDICASIKLAFNLNQKIPKFRYILVYTFDFRARLVRGSLPVRVAPAQVHHDDLLRLHGGRRRGGEVRAHGILISSCKTSKWTPTLLLRNSWCADQPIGTLSQSQTMTPILV